MRIFGATDKGLVRTLNQDAYSCDASRGLVILSDGMGGHAAGEIASHMVVEGLTEHLSSLSDLALNDVPLKIDEAIQSVNAKLRIRGQEDATCRGMGATANVLCFSHGFATIGHVGDSRTYLIRAFMSAEGKPRFALWQLTIDHNLGTFVDRGILNTNGAEPMSLRERSKLTRGMGVMPDPKPDIYTKRLTDGDVFLSCSDGLHGCVSDRDVLRTLVSGPIAEAPQRLIEIAKAAGAPDNVTVILSVVSNLTEPFREFTGPTFQTRPFLLRLPTGEIQGPFLAKEIIELWIRRKLPSSTELASSLTDWVQLRNKENTIKSFSEFKTDTFINHVHYETSQEVTEPPPSEPTPTPTSTRNHQNRGLFLGLTLVFITFAFLALLLSIDFSRILLPAY